MNVLHYAGIRKNMSSGVSVIVPEIVSAQSELMNVCFYNYGESSFETSNNIISLDRQSNDDYHTFLPPFNKQFTYLSDAKKGKNTICYSSTWLFFI